MFFLILRTVAAQQLFPGIQGDALLDSLVLNYKPAFVLGYDDARDKMYALIDNQNDSVTCVYTGYQVYVPYNDPDPRSYTNAPSPIMNAEHTWPTSKGASGNAKSDLHHLYPTNEYANSARGSLPFGEVPDQLTDRWWRGISYITTIPVNDKPAYSREQTNVRFEPREDHQGNVARSMFYFYTMYRDEADTADPDFFLTQKDVLYTWHIKDPADAAEISRTDMIAAYQDDRPNPFVLDSTLIRRCYFPVSGLPSDAPTEVLHGFELQQNYPNPFNGVTRIGFSIERPAYVRLAIYDLRGVRIDVIHDGQVSAGMHRLSWMAGRETASGVYFYRLEILEPVAVVRTKKMILVK